MSSVPFVVLLILGHAYGQGTGGASRPAAEKAIRANLYEMALANLTGDVAKFKKHAAKRTLGLYDLIFAELSSNPTMKEQFQKSGVTNGQGFLDLGMRAVASHSAAMPAAKLEALARDQAAGDLKFVSDTEAAGTGPAGTYRAVFENNDWKIDITEILKKTYLQSLPLAADSKARIEKY